MQPEFSPNILCLETSTEVCSVAVIKGGLLASLQESFLRFRHGEWLTIAIAQAMEAAELKREELHAISITIGPGSYTGLRVGLATAKALCLTLDIPIVCHSSLEVLAYGIKDSYCEDELLIPMMDARRMEVYTACFNGQMERLSEDKPVILDKEWIDGIVDKNLSVVIGGDGAEKSLPLWGGEKFLRFPVKTISAQYQLIPAVEKYKIKKFQDIAYVSPTYLKKPNITKPSRTL